MAAQESALALFTAGVLPSILIGLIDAQLSDGEDYHQMKGDSKDFLSYSPGDAGLRSQSGLFAGLFGRPATSIDARQRSP